MGTNVYKTPAAVLRDDAGQSVWKGFVHFELGKRREETFVDELTWNLSGDPYLYHLCWGDCLEEEKRGRSSY